MTIKLESLSRAALRLAVCWALAPALAQTPQTPRQAAEKMFERKAPAGSMQACSLITRADIVSDLDAHQLAKNISKRIEAEMQYPGHIKVVVIRETRAVEVAR